MPGGSGQRTRLPGDLRHHTTFDASADSALSIGMNFSVVHETVPEAGFPAGYSP
jgi:hypothetical protein